MINQKYVWVVQRRRDDLFFDTSGRWSTKRSPRFYPDSRFAGNMISYLSEADYNYETKKTNWPEISDYEKNLYKARYKKIRYELVYSPE